MFIHNVISLLYSQTHAHNKTVSSRQLPWVASHVESIWMGIGLVFVRCSFFLSFRILLILLENSVQYSFTFSFDTGSNSIHFVSFESHFLNICIFLSSQGKIDLKKKSISSIYFGAPQKKKLKVFERLQLPNWPWTISTDINTSDSEPSELAHMWHLIRT